MITPQSEIIFADDTAFCDNGQTYSSIDEALDHVKGDVKLFILSSISETVHIHNRNAIVTTIGLTVTVQQSFSEFLSVSRGTLYIEDARFSFDTPTEDGISFSAIHCSNGGIVLFSSTFYGNKAMTLVDADASSVYMRGLQTYRFSKGVVGNCALVLDSSTLRVLDTGVSLTEGEVQIVETLIVGPTKDTGTVGVAYSGVHGELNVNCCLITRFVTGIQTSGTALIQEAVIKQCRDYGIFAQNTTEPYLCEVNDCKINRCKHGVFTKGMFVAIVDSVIRYATVGVFADAAYSTRLETTVIYACDTIIHCFNSQVMKVLGCCLYDCRTVFDINTLDCFSVCGCRILYFRRVAFLMTNFVEQFALQDNGICINDNNAEFEKLATGFHINEPEVDANVLYTKKEVEHQLMVFGEYSIIPRIITVSPIKRERADQIRELLESIM